MASKKISQLAAVTIPLDTDNLFETSEDDGMGGYISKKVTLQELISKIGILDSGSYTPVLTNSANIAASTAYKCLWSRVGSIVTVSGRVDIDITVSGVFRLDMTLPINSDFATLQDCSGVSNIDLASTVIIGRAVIAAEFGSDKARLQGTTSELTNQKWLFTYQYEII